MPFAQIQRVLLALFLALPVVVVRPASGAEGPSKQLYIMDMTERKLRPLPPFGDYDAPGSPDWSPDGTRIACDVWRTRVDRNYVDTHIFTCRPDGSDFQDLGDGCLPSWSADSKRIAFSRYNANRGVWVMNADGSGMKLIDDEGWSPEWSPDGRKIVYTVRTSEGPNLMLYDVETDKLETILEPFLMTSYSSLHWALGWSPDSKQICFSAHLKEDPKRQDFVVVRASGSQHGMGLVPGDPVVTGYAWHPDGKTVLFSRKHPESKLPQLYLIDPNNPGKPVWIEGQKTDERNTTADWSPDGKKIIYSGQAVK